jgi:putative transposase/transposase-like zinc-binding protein
VVEKFLGCGDLTKGFARIRCDACRHEYLLAFSCKGRYFCPSCHQKRVLQFGGWVAEEVLAPVPHRQYVFTIPKMLRVYFRKDRRPLGKLSQCAVDALKILFRAACKDQRAIPGIITAIQTYGDLVNFHPHLHTLVTEGAFSPTGWFLTLPKIDLIALEHLFRHRVLRPLLRERRIDEMVIRKLLGWRHSGFSLHNAVRIGPHDIEGRRAFSEYVLRSPFSLEKLRYQATTGTIIYQSKMHPTLKRNFEVFSATDWLAALTAHIPNAGEHLVRYYGWYSNVSRGKRRKAQGQEHAPIEEVNEVSASAAKRAWARLIKQVYEVDPLICPRCTGPMRIIAFIEQPEVIEKILTHVGLCPTHIHSPPAGTPVAVFPATGRIAA